MSRCQTEIHSGEKSIYGFLKKFINLKTTANANANQVEKREKKSRLIGLLRELGGAKTLVFLRFGQMQLGVEIIESHFLFFSRTKHKTQKLAEQLYRFISDKTNIGNQFTD